MIVACSRQQGGTLASEQSGVEGWNRGLCAASKWPSTQQEGITEAVLCVSSARGRGTALTANDALSEKVRVRSGQVAMPPIWPSPRRQRKAILSPGSHSGRASRPTHTAPSSDAPRHPHRQKWRRRRLRGRPLGNTMGGRRPRPHRHSIRLSSEIRSISEGAPRRRRGTSDVRRACVVPYQFDIARRRNLRRVRCQPRQVAMPTWTSRVPGSRTACSHSRRHFQFQAPRGCRPAGQFQSPRGR